MNQSFVILAHDGHGPSHFDLMFSIGTALATWQCPRDPAGLPVGQSMSCQKLPDHRLAYLDYEGPISGGRGSVRRVEQGRYEAALVSEERWDVQIIGQGMEGRFILRRLKDDKWTLQRRE
ncbi:MAG: hypothetical protein K8S55_03140 [Phycisphaerae bacterium]|nr:hypothetical protein [Phycisphaerae bacterium]